jgi:hypothetical protein
VRPATGALRGGRHWRGGPGAHAEGAGGRGGRLAGLQGHPRASPADDPYEWPRDNKYRYASDKSTLDCCVKKGRFLAVRKTDPTPMKGRKDGSHEGEVTPACFTFTGARLLYPLKATTISVWDRTEALCSVQVAHKVDLPGDFSYQPARLHMPWLNSMCNGPAISVPDTRCRREARATVREKSHACSVASAPGPSRAVALSCILAGTSKHLGFNPLAYLREMLRGLFSPGQSPRRSRCCSGCRVLDCSAVPESHHVKRSGPDKQRPSSRSAVSTG